ncbi:substrate-binding domain-containing protein [Ramlibacter alkalitolerans]|uniref:Substrate-binding domain-containing protein n=1 Tax=Ramlibacter alkalitolerans TaxID=2039631 RepID=A0ABS1JQJ5_9BURK|nr:substrate-binding domain-containing protein [Ramlibacter alkalitolerans]
MNTVHSFVRCAAVLAAGWTFALAAAADEVKVLVAGAFQPVVSAIAPVYEKRTGHKLAVLNEAEGALADRIRAGEDFDLAVLPQSLLEALGKDGAVSDGSIIALARAGAGRQEGTVYVGAVSPSAANSPAALSLLILLASEETQAVLKSTGLSAP